jgi:hypothetical protein
MDDMKPESHMLLEGAVLSYGTFGENHAQPCLLSFSFLNVLQRPIGQAIALNSRTRGFSKEVGININ